LATVCVDIRFPLLLWTVNYRAATRMAALVWPLLRTSLDFSRMNPPFILGARSLLSWRTFLAGVFLDIEFLSVVSVGFWGWELLQLVSAPDKGGEREEAKQSCCYQRAPVTSVGMHDLSSLRREPPSAIVRLM
jgi:hypothetical protein